MENQENKTTDGLKITGDWNEQSRTLRSKFSSLTDDDLKFESGKENELIGRIEKRLNKGRQEVINIIRKGQPQIS